MSAPFVADDHDDMAHVEHMPIDAVRGKIHQLEMRLAVPLMLQFIHTKKRGRIGTTVGYVHPDKHIPMIGWSLCRQGDKFDRERGIYMAMLRAQPCTYYMGPSMQAICQLAPAKIVPILAAMIARVTEYWSRTATCGDPHEHRPRRRKCKHEPTKVQRRGIAMFENRIRRVVNTVLEERRPQPPDALPSKCC